MKRSLSLNQVLDRYNDSFGWMAMKIAPRLAHAGFGGANFMLSGIETYAPTDVTFADVIFTSNKTGHVYSFGVNGKQGSHSAFSFVKDKKAKEQMFMAPPLMVKFSRGKNAIITPIDQSDGEVIENFGLQSWKVSISGIAIDVEEHQYPGALLSEINEMFSVGGTFRVTSDIFYDLGIKDIFFKDGFEVNFVEGYADTVKFSVEAISTAPAQFIVTGF